MARRATFDRDVWCAACGLICRHGRDATRQAAQGIEARLIDKDLDGALAWMLVSEAVAVLLAEKPQRGEPIH